MKLSLDRAFLFGIDSYDIFSPLSGCVNDALALEPLLSLHESGLANFRVISRTTNKDRVTKNSLLNDLESLLAPGANIALMYFAGHGQFKQGELFLVPQDGAAQDLGVPFSEIHRRIAASPVPEVLVILDCCFSGRAGDLSESGINEARLRKGVCILTASRADQEAVETTGGQGKFSYYLAAGLKGGAADVLGRVTVAGLYSYLSESLGAFDQRPMLKAHVEHLHEVRLCKPSVLIEDLKRVTGYFPYAEYEFPLDPSFEPTLKPRNGYNESIFKVLQAFRANKLLEPIGTEHMYYAAKEKKPCRLTPLGRHYWHLVKSQRI